MPVFSIIVPVYNVEAYLRESVGSLQQQSFTDIEIILVDDGSTDNSAAIADELAASDQRISVYKKKGGGASTARNLGLKHATGTYIYCMDSDDIVAPGMLEQLNNVFDTQGTDLVAFTAVSFLDKDFAGADNTVPDLSSNFYARNFLAEKKYTGREFYQCMTDENNFVASVCLFAVKRGLLTQQQIHFHEGIMHEDELFSRTLFLAAENVYFLKQPFYQRRIRANSVSTRNPDPHKAFSLLTVAEGIEELYKKYSITALRDDSKQFVRWTIDWLLTFKERTAEYDKVLRQLLRSPVTKNIDIGFKTTMHLKYKKFGQLQQSLVSMRMKLGLRTRLKSLLRMNTSRQQS
ncbi:glycosyltransferase family 2 protein [Ferruginibacter sp. HRS2-29]|uniref:glycosyltransferase family 2 protein n=1 Tax=Ferruginibacter sp. HRS2-29 TaxID=2487334 RepID=UPI0020CD80D8|nr:glycosyltransferase family 2 protein [Ferruginibacter sp. HRS2-29]